MIQRKLYLITCMALSIVLYSNSFISNGYPQTIAGAQASEDQPIVVKNKSATDQDIAPAGHVMEDMSFGIKPAGYDVTTLADGESELYMPIGGVFIPTGYTGIPRGVEEKDEFIYLLSRGDWPNIYNGYLFTYNVSDLPERTIFTHYDSPTKIISSTNNNGLLRNGNYLYAFGYNGLTVFNIQNPATPIVIGSRYDLVIYNLVQYGNYLIAPGHGGVAVYSVSNPASPALLSIYRVPNKNFFSAAVYGNFLYTSEFEILSTDPLTYINDFRVLDFSNPSSLSLIHLVNRNKTAFHMRVVGNRLVECSDSSVFGGYVGLWSLDTPSNPVFLTSQPADARVCAIDGSNIVVSGSAFRIDGNTLSPIDTFPAFSHADGFPYGSTVTSDFVFLAGDSGILILKYTASTISGGIMDTGGNPLPGVIVTAYPGYSAVVDSQGYYLIDDVSPGTYRITPSLTGYAFSPTSRWVTLPPAAVEQNFIGTPIEIERFEVNQVLGQQKDGEQNYVAGKATALRVFLNVPIEIDQFAQRVTVKRDGETITILYPILQLGTTSVLTYICPNLIACDHWQAGDYTFDVVVNTVNYQSPTYIFVEHENMHVLAIPVQVSVDGENIMPDPGWRTSHDFLSKVYPIASNGLDWIEGPTLDATDLNLNNDDDQIELIDRLDNRQPFLCGLPTRPPCYDQIIGFIPDVEICDARGCVGGWTTGSSVSVVMTKEDMQATVAHEIGHNYGLGDEYGRVETYDNMCGSFQCDINPPPPEYCGRNGIWPCIGDFKCDDSIAVPWTGSGTGSTVISTLDHPYDVTNDRGTLGNMLSFMGSSETMDNYWITPDIYHQLFGELSTATQVIPATTQDEMVIQASGIIGKNGSVQIHPWIALTTTPPVSVSGEYSIEALDAADKVLVNQGFDVSFVMLSDPPTDLDSAPFQAVLPFPVGTAAFQIKHGEDVLSRVEVSDHTPEVTLISPNGGQIWGSTGEATITWSGSDVDEDTLYYTVLYTPDGTDWLTLGTNITTTQTTVALDEIPGGDQARIQIIATDGINTSIDESDGTFVVGDKGPSAYILSPEDQAVIPTGTSFYLRGYGYDLEDGNLKDASLAWHSSLDGNLGSGTLLLVNLSSGHHTITLTATDGSGAQDTDEIRIYIGSLINLPVLRK